MAGSVFARPLRSSSHVITVLLIAACGDATHNPSLSQRDDDGVRVTEVDRDAVRAALGVYVDELGRQGVQLFRYQTPRSFAAPATR